jgi:N-acetylglucosaminyldiphosphoundecaprenol N-acetyl-beta-D-mannosaminyltransferase
MSLVLDIDDYDLANFSVVARDFGEARYGFVVTPNADHLIRYCDDAFFRGFYASAAYVLLDSRFVANLVALTRGIRLRVCPGSDLTEHLLANVVESHDKVVLVGGTPQQAQSIRESFGLNRLHHINPKMGFIHDADAVEECLRSIESASPFRFCFIAVGSPQQEMIAQELQTRGRARGLALCVGASVDFITGVERRAPPWLQRSGFEWIYRLVQNPSRLAGRYLIRGPRIFRLLPLIDLRTRSAAAPAVSE